MLISLFLTVLTLISSSFGQTKPQICEGAWIYERHERCASPHHPKLPEERRLPVCGVESTSKETWRDHACGVESYKSCPDTNGKILQFVDTGVSERSERSLAPGKDLTRCKEVAAHLAERATIWWKAQGHIKSGEKYQIRQEVERAWSDKFLGRLHIDYLCAVRVILQKPVFESTRRAECGVEQFKECPRTITYKSCRRPEFGLSQDPTPLRSPHCPYESTWVFASQPSSSITDVDSLEPITCSTCDDVKVPEQRLKCVANNLASLEAAQKNKTLFASENASELKAAKALRENWSEAPLRIVASHLDDKSNSLKQEKLIAEVANNFSPRSLSILIPGRFAQFMNALSISYFQKMLDAGFDYNKPDADGRTPLQIATQKKDEEYT